MHYSLSTTLIQKMTVPEYENAQIVDEEIIGVLMKADSLTSDALIYLEDGGRVDNSAQREYIKIQVDSMLYLLEEIKDKLEG